MANPVRTPAATEAAPEFSAADDYAVLVIDAGGNVVASNASARRMWSSECRSLVTSPLVMLLGTDGASTEPEHLSTQWRALTAESLDRWTSRVALPFDGPPRAVRVRLERAMGGAGSYIAVVRGESMCG